MSFELSGQSSASLRPVFGQSSGARAEAELEQVAGESSDFGISPVRRRIHFTARPMAHLLPSAPSVRSSFPPRQMKRKVCPLWESDLDVRL